MTASNNKKSNWRHYLILLFVTLVSLVVISHKLSSTWTHNFLTATAISIENQEIIEVGGQDLFVQEIKFKTSLSEFVILPIGSTFQPLRAEQLLRVGQSVILNQNEAGELTVVEIYRLPILLLLGLIFIGVVLAVATFHGVKSLVALVATLAVIIGWLVPTLLTGHNPILTAILGCTVIGAISLYIGHGWGWKAHLSVMVITITLFTASALATVVINLTQLAGLGSHESYVLQYGPTNLLNFQGLLLAGIMLGTLGILDDIVISQIAIVFQLKAAQPKLVKTQLFKRALNVGKDHIASLVNTLILAYTGSNLPLFLLILGQDRWPWWVTLSNEAIAEEVVRTLVGSIALVLAVPLATLLACLALERKTLKQLVTEDEL